MVVRKYEPMRLVLLALIMFTQQPHADQRACLQIERTSQIFVQHGADAPGSQYAGTPPVAIGVGAASGAGDNPQATLAGQGWDPQSQNLVAGY